MAALTLLLGLGACSGGTSSGDPELGSVRLYVFSNLAAIDSFEVEIRHFDGSYGIAATTTITPNGGSGPYGEAQIDFLTPGPYVGSVQAWIGTVALGLPVEFRFDITAGQTTFVDVTVDVRQGTSSGSVNLAVTAVNGAEVGYLTFAERSPGDGLQQTHSIYTANADAGEPFEVSFVSWDANRANAGHTASFWSPFPSFGPGAPAEITYTYSATSVVSTYACVIGTNTQAGNCVEYIEDAVQGSMTRDVNHWLRAREAVNSSLPPGSFDTMVLTNGVSTKVIVNEQPGAGTPYVNAYEATGVAVTWGFVSANVYQVRVRESASQVWVVTVDGTGGTTTVTTASEF